MKGRLDVMLSMPAKEEDKDPRKSWTQEIGQWSLPLPSQKVQMDTRNIPSRESMTKLLRDILPQALNAALVLKWSKRVGPTGNPTSEEILLVSGRILECLAGRQRCEEVTVLHRLFFPLEYGEPLGDISILKHVGLRDDANGPVRGFCVTNNAKADRVLQVVIHGKGPHNDSLRPLDIGSGEIPYHFDQVFILLLIG